DNAAVSSRSQLDPVATAAPHHVMSDVGLLVGANDESGIRTVEDLVAAHDVPVIEDVGHDPGATSLDPIAHDRDRLPAHPEPLPRAVHDDVVPDRTDDLEANLQAIIETTHVIAFD